MKRAHVIGNGPSWSKFPYANYQNDYKLGCNKPPFATNATLILDRRMLFLIRDGKVNIQCPLIIPDKLLPLVDKWYITIDQTFNDKSWKGFVLSSAHWCAIVLAEKKFDVIHVWGCDSFLTPTLKSTTDQFISVSCKDNQNHVIKHIAKWNRSWQTIVQKYSSTKFVFENLPTKNLLTNGQ